MLPLTAPDHSSPHSPSPSANNNLPVRLSAKNTSFLHSGNPSTPKHSVESYPYRKTSKFYTICSRNFSVLINQSQKTPEIFFSFYLQTSHQSINSRRSALRTDPAYPPVLQHTLPFHTQQFHADLPSGQIQPLLPSSNPRIWLRRRGTCRADGRIGIIRPPMPPRPSVRQVPRRRSQIRPPHTNRAADPSSAAPQIIL